MNEGTKNVGMSRRSFMKGSSAAVLGGIVASQTRAHAVDRSRPNILIIMTDQQNIDTIAAYRDFFGHPAYGCDWVHTPNLDRLVRRGVSFMESHSPNPVCSPGRSACFTGRPTIENAVVVNNVGIDRNVPNMGQWFEENSEYRRIYCGKWHAGGMWNYPTVEGDRKIPGFETLPAGSKGTGDFADYQVSCSVEAFLRNYNEPEPFLLVAGLMNPHDICHLNIALAGTEATPEEDTFRLGDKLPPLPPNFEYDFDDPTGGPYRQFNEMQWRNTTYDYYRMVEKVDADVGRMMDAVDDRDDDTIIIFTSDHGEGIGRHQRVQKWHPFEHSVKVPLILSCPGRIEEGAIDSSHLVSGLDIMSTVCDYAGIPSPPHDRGRSLRPMLEGDTPEQWHDNAYIELQVTGRIIRTEQYKYCTFYEYSRDEARPFVRKIDGFHTQFEPGKGHTYRENPVKLLFNIKEDPWELRNLSLESQYADVMADHEKILREQWEARLIPGTWFVRGNPA